MNAMEWAKKTDQVIEALFVLGLILMTWGITACTTCHDIYAILEDQHRIFHEKAIDSCIVPSPNKDACLVSDAFGIAVVNAAKRYYRRNRIDPVWCGFPGLGLVLVALCLKSLASHRRKIV